MPAATEIPKHHTNANSFSLLVRLNFSLGVNDSPLQKLPECHPSETRIFHGMVQFRNSGCISRRRGKAKMSRDKGGPVNKATESFQIYDTLAEVILFDEDGHPM